MRNMTARFNYDENERHPLINLVVAHNLFGFLPLKDIVNCHIVCKKWNKIAELFLRKRAKIHFDDVKPGPAQFMDVFNDFLPSIPYTSFKFSTFDKTLNMSELSDFFHRFGSNIKSLEFDNVRLRRTGQGKLPRKYLEPRPRLYTNVITTWIENTPNLNKLKVDMTLDCLLELRLDKLTSVESLSLEYCYISGRHRQIRIAPLEIFLNDVSFVQNGRVLDDIRLNDYFDFSKSSIIKLYGDPDENKIFDMARQSFNTECLTLVNIELENWTAAKGKVDFFYLEGFSFLAKNQLDIKQLYLNEGSIDLAALPQSVEKLRFEDIDEFICFEMMLLPNLNYLHVDHPRQMMYFLNCVNLRDLELGSKVLENWKAVVNFCWIPTSVKRMKINFKSVLLRGGGDDYILELDTLILENFLHCLLTDVVQILSKIKPKVLVVSHWNCKGEDLDTTEIVHFKMKYPQMKIVIGTVNGVDLYGNTDFETSMLASSVDYKKANFYEFESNAGKVITEKEFETWRQLDGLDERFCKPIDQETITIV